MNRHEQARGTTKRKSRYYKKKRTIRNNSDSPFLVPAIGLEPIRLLGLRILSPVRLPIPPRGHKILNLR